MPGDCADRNGKRQDQRGALSIRSQDVLTSSGASKTAAGLEHKLEGHNREIDAWAELSYGADFPTLAMVNRNSFGQSDARFDRLGRISVISLTASYRPPWPPDNGDVLPVVFGPQLWPG